MNRDPLLYRAQYAIDEAAELCSTMLGGAVVGIGPGFLAVAAPRAFDPAKYELQLATHPQLAEEWIRTAQSVAAAMSDLVAIYADRERRDRAGG